MASKTSDSFLDQIEAEVEALRARVEGLDSSKPLSEFQKEYEELMAILDKLNKQFAEEG